MPSSLYPKTRTRVRDALSAQAAASASQEAPGFPRAPPAPQPAQSGEAQPCIPLLSAQDSSGPLVHLIAMGHGGGEDDKAEKPTLAGRTTEKPTLAACGDETATLAGWGEAAADEDRGEADESSPLSGWGEAVAEARHPPEEGLAGLHPFAVDALGGRVRGLVF